MTARSTSAELQTGTADLHPDERGPLGQHRPLGGVQSNVIRVRSPLMIRTYPARKALHPRRARKTRGQPAGRALVFVVVPARPGGGRPPTGAGIGPGAGRENCQGSLAAADWMRGGSVLVHLGVPAHDLYLPSDQPIAPPPIRPV